MKMISLLSNYLSDSVYPELVITNVEQSACISVTIRLTTISFVLISIGVLI
jgi:hypothetical protein